MRNFVFTLLMMSCIPVSEDSETAAAQAPQACVINDTKALFTKVAKKVTPPRLNKTPNGLEFDFRGEDIAQSANNYCKNNLFIQFRTYFSLYSISS